jgi:hypothetical protein
MRKAIVPNIFATKFINRFIAVSYTKNKIIVANELLIK